MYGTLFNLDGGNVLFYSLHFLTALLTPSGLPIFCYWQYTSDRFHLGVIAQEVEEAMNNVGISSKDFVGLVIDEQGNYFVRYDEINVLTALKVKQLEKRISILQKELRFYKKFVFEIYY